MKSVLLIDDDETHLKELKAALVAKLDTTIFEVLTWVPVGGEGDADTKFDSLVNDDTAMVVTDYDLSKRGMSGLFGASVVDWCQSKAIPVGDFSRRHKHHLPQQPNLFEIRVPVDADESATHIAAIVNGFRLIEQGLDDVDNLAESLRSPAAVLAKILGVPNEASQFGLYGVRLSTASAGLIDKITDPAPNDAMRKRVLTYVVGHLLWNSILRYSGPILDRQALLAFLSAPEQDADAVLPWFDAAQYAGPFAELGPFFWLTKSVDIVQELIDALPDTDQVVDIGLRNRQAIERKLGRELAKHGCTRCGGINGGFVCPLTKRIVCQRADCSVGSNSWVPQGARLCRIERDYYDEWAPLLGI